jgi:hypothetical protein
VNKGKKKRKGQVYSRPSEPSSNSIRSKLLLGVLDDDLAILDRAAGSGLAGSAATNVSDHTTRFKQAVYVATFPGQSPRHVLPAFMRCTYKTRSRVG